MQLSYNNGISSLRSRQAALPVLSLDFIGNQTLDPRITFARASIATRFDSSGTLVTMTNNQPRYDFNPSTLVQRGLLMEETRTNSIRNNTMVGAVAGTPGTLPTNWFTYVSSGTGVAQNVIGTGTQNGVAYVDIQFVGTPSATANWSVIFEPAGAMAAATGQSWTGSFWLRFSAGSLTNVSSPVIFIDETAGATFVTGGTYATTLTSTWERKAQARTLSGGGTVTSANLGVRFNVTAGQPIDITLRIGLPQFEQGAFETSVIPTSTAAVTRAADTATMTGTNFSNWYRQSEGTMYAEYSLNALNPAAGQNALSINAASNLNRLNLRSFQGASNNAFIVTTAGTGVASLVSALAVAGVVQKLAGAYRTDDFAYSDKGGTVQTDNLGGLPTPIQAQLGHALGLEQLNGHLRRIDYYNVRLPNSRLQAITA